MPRTLIMDDHVIVRVGLKNILAGNLGIEVTAEAAGGIQAVSTVHAEPLEAVVMDTFIPG